MSQDLTCDEQLMADYVAGDRAAFAELYQRYHPTLRALLNRRLNSPALVDDLVQQAFLQMHRARNDFRAGSKVRPWLFTIAMNLARSHLRRGLRSPFQDVEQEGRAEPEQLRDQQRRELRKLVDDLPDMQKQVIVLYWFEGYSFPEIATQLGATVSAVKVRAHRGYNAIRAKLQEERNQSEGSS